MEKNKIELEKVIKIEESSTKDKTNDILTSIGDPALAELFVYYSAQPYSQDTLISMLREIQELYGFIDRGLSENVAAVLGVNIQVVNKIIKLYPSLKSRPAVHRIVVCTGSSCGNKNSLELLNVLRKSVAARPAGMFQVISRNCLKNCRTSPNFIIDDHLYQGVRLEDVEGILDKIPPLS